MDHHLGDGRPEERGDLSFQILDFQRVVLAAGSLVSQIESENGAGLSVPDEENRIGAERQGAHGLYAGVARHEPNLGGGSSAGGGKHDYREENRGELRSGYQGH